MDNTENRLWVILDDSTEYTPANLTDAIATVSEFYKPDEARIKLTRLGVVYSYDRKFVTSAWLVANNVPVPRKIEPIEIRTGFLVY